MRGLEVIFWTVFVALMVPAGSLTVVRLVEPDSARALQIQAFTPLAFPLYAVALVMLSVAAVRATTDKALFLAPAVLALLGLAAHFFWLSPQFLGPNPEPAAGAEPMRVMTANLFAGEADTVALVERVRTEEVDLLVVNEITDRALRDMLRVGLDESLPFGVGTPGQDVEGTMIFSREPIVEIARVGTQFDSVVARTMGMVVIGVHPVPPLEPDQWRADHDAIFSAVGEFDPDLVLGDFNATPDHEPMRRLSENGYRDSVEITNGVFMPTWPANGLYPILGLLGPTAPIDHVLVSSDIAVVQTGTLDLPDSDHRSVVTVIARR